MTASEDREFPTDAQDQVPSELEHTHSAEHGVREDNDSQVQTFDQIFEEYYEDLKGFAEKNNYDVLLYNALLNLDGYKALKNEIVRNYTGGIDSTDVDAGESFEQLILEQIAKYERRVLLILITEGGDATVAFNCSRLLQYLYQGNFSVYIPSYCKSAGTLVCLGASSIIMSEFGELGPLDVQLQRPENNLRNTMQGTGAMSGAEIPNASIYAGKMAIRFFIDFVNSTKDLAGKNAAVEAGKEVTIGLFQGIYQQIDPDFLGVIHRLMSISEDYGTRLSSVGGNVKEGAIQRLIYHYPDHSSVIDYTEATRLFFSVYRPDPLIQKISFVLNRMRADDIRSEPTIRMLASPKTNVAE